MDLLNPLPGIAQNLVHLLLLLIAQIQFCEHCLESARPSMKRLLPPCGRALDFAMAIKVDCESTRYKSQRENRNYSQPDSPLLAVNRFHKNPPGRTPYRGPGPTSGCRPRRCCHP